MATSLWNLLKEHKIVIPIIQRDYAQGREIGKVPAIRDKFLNALLSAFEKNASPLVLDFIYGYINGDEDNISNISKTFIPLDGQQRLTTLFLLHWYFAAKEKQIEIAKPLLSKFTYETRHSTRVFCNQLVKFNLEDFNISIKETIINQPWFFTTWKNDPTISSMLTMLDAIQIKFNNCNDIWKQLTSDNPPIIFHFLSMGKLGLSDELYIKMNSRGKELTEFEYFKSQFSELLNTAQLNEFKAKIDQEWSDLFWNLYKEEEDRDIARLVDEGFMRYFRFISELLLLKINPNADLSIDDIELTNLVYKNDTDNIQFLFLSLNEFESVYSGNPIFFEELFYIELKDFNNNNVRLFFNRSNKDLFKKCSYSYDSSQRNNLFSIGEQLLLYSCVIHLINKSENFSDRIRIVRNLISNSEDTVRKENMSSLLNAVSEIILSGNIDDNSKFNNRQIEEEKLKQLFFQNNISLKTSIYQIEDHFLLQGCLAIFNFEPEILCKSLAFQKVFTNYYDTISSALLTIGDYSQKYGLRRRFGNNNDSVWRELLTPSQRRGDFQNTKEVLNCLLDQIIKDPVLKLENIISSYLAEFEINTSKPKDWRFYYIKYPEFRRNEDGFYYWQIPNKQYECLMMRRSTFIGFNWDPFLNYFFQNNVNSLNLENYEAPLILSNSKASVKITMKNDGLKFESYDDVESQKFLSEILTRFNIGIDGSVKVLQSDNGLDLEDRVKKFHNLISDIIKAG